MSTTDSVTLAPGTVARTSVDANLREAPDLQARVLTVLPRGAVVQAAPSSLPDWCRVTATSTGQRGYVFGALLDPGQPPAGSQVITPQTRLIAAARGSLSQIQDTLLSRPHGLYSAEDIRFIARVYFESAVPARLDPVIAIAQALETGNCPPRSRGPDLQLRRHRRGRQRATERQEVSEHYRGRPCPRRTPDHIRGRRRRGRTRRRRPSCRTH